MLVAVLITSTAMRLMRLLSFSLITMFSIQFCHVLRLMFAFVFPVNYCV